VDEREDKNGNRVSKTMNYSFVNGIGNGQYRDTQNGNTGNVDDLTRQTGRSTRGFDFTN
jgi:hypothetical protein